MVFQFLELCVCICTHVPVEPWARTFYFTDFFPRLIFCPLVRDHVESCGSVGLAESLLNSNWFMTFHLKSPY